MDTIYCTKVKLVKVAGRKVPYDVVRYYADGSKRVANRWKKIEDAQAEVARIQAAIDDRSVK